MYGKHVKHIILDETAFEPHCIDPEDIERKGRKAYYTAFSKYGCSGDEFLEHFRCPDEKLA